MADSLGVSFAPGGSDATQRPTAPANPVQQAIQVLSLRIPHTVGQSPLAPSPLLNAPTGQALPGDLTALLQRLAGLLGMPQGANPYGNFQQQEKQLNPNPPSLGSGPGPSLSPKLPTPSITPGVLPNEPKFDIQPQQPALTAPQAPSMPSLPSPFQRRTPSPFD
jgi:hypothetical protein